MKSLVLNYGVGNLYSISSSLKRAGFEVVISGSVESDYDLYVFPGVGSFRSVARYIDSLRDKLEELRSNGAAFLGICIGMHILFEYGLEGGYSRGLGWFKGYVDKLKTDLKLPHISWGKVYVKNLSNSCSIAEIMDNQYVYFIHSYVAYPHENSVVCLTSVYGAEFPAMVARDRVIGVQFHPEKSGSIGIEFLKAVKGWLKR